MKESTKCVRVDVLTLNGTKITHLPGTMGILSLDKMTHKQRAIFGFMLLGIWALLIGIIAIGHVEEQTSFGLRDCITGLAFLSGSWAQATFGSVKGDKEKEDEKFKEIEKP